MDLEIHTCTYRLTITMITSWIHAVFNISLRKYYLITYYIPSTVLDNRDIIVSKDRQLCSRCIQRASHQISNYFQKTARSSSFGYTFYPCYLWANLPLKSVKRETKAQLFQTSTTNYLKFLVWFLKNDWCVFHLRREFMPVFSKCPNTLL